MRKRLLLSIVVLLLSGCGLFNPHDALNLNAELYPGTYGLKDFRQFADTLAVATSNENPTNLLKTIRAGVETRLSADGDPLKMSPPMMQGMITLASAYCDERINLDRVKSPENRAMHAHVSFASPFIGALTDDLRRQSIAEYSGAFWGREPTDEEVSIVLEAMSAAETGDGNLAELWSVLLTACTLIASSVSAFSM